MTVSRIRRGIVAAATAAASLAILTPAPAHADTVATGAFSPLSPTRIVDTRSGVGAAAGKIAPGGTIHFQVSGIGGVPAEATAVALNLTIVDAARAGFASLWSVPAGSSAPAGNPATSSVNLGAAGATVANMSVIALSADGSLNLFSDAGGYAIIDIAGYWTPAAEATAGRYTAMTPMRTLDTRGNARLAAGGVIEATVAGLGSVPADAAAVAVTITATGAAQAGFITGWPSGTGRPDASNLNLPSAGSTVPNLAILPVGANGRISLYSSGGTDLIVDIAGWFTGASAPSSSDGLFVPLPVSRIVDTRSHVGMRRLSADLSSEMPAAGLGGVPATGVAAVAVNLTVTGTLDDGFLTASPAGVSLPNASNVNFRRGQDVAGLSFAGLGANGKVNLFSVSSTNVIADVAGYFTGSPIADQGVHPMACENMMSLIREDGATRTLLLRDRTGATADIVVASGLSDISGGRLIGNCDFVAVYKRSANGSARVERVSLGGRVMGLVTAAGTFSSQTWSPDGMYFYTTEGFSTTGNTAYAARTIYRTNTYTGQRQLLLDTKANAIWDIENFGNSGQYLYLSAIVGGSGYGEVQLDTTTGQATTPFVGTNTYLRALSPDGRYQARVDHVGTDNNWATVCLSNTSCLSFAADWVAFTAQNELVTFRDETVTIYTFSEVGGVLVLANSSVLSLASNEFAPWFSTYALV